MRVIVFGAFGMLGRAVCETLITKGHVPITPPRSECDISDVSHVIIAMGLANSGHPDDPVGAVINCAGQTGLDLNGRLPSESERRMAMANCVGPLVLADQCQKRKVRLVHVSTDCVFSGEPGEPGRRLDEKDTPCPDSLYGRTKLAGEPHGPNIVVVRTSFIGPQSGLLAWLRASDGGTVQGWRRAYWTGSTAHAVAERLIDLATMKMKGIDEKGALLHAATPSKMNKYDVLCLARDALGLNIEIEPVDEPHIDRALKPTVPLKPLDEALAEMVERWKHSDQAKAKA